MRVTICDVCGEKYEPDADLIEMKIPAEMLGHEGEDGITVDVCSWPCVTHMVDQILSTVSGEDEDEEVQEEEKPQAFIAVPKTPTIDTSMDEKTLARFTEQVTGVKRR